MPAGTLNLEGALRIEQGASYRLGVAWRDTAGVLRDLSTGWTARLQVRLRRQSPTAMLSLTSDPDGGIRLTNGALEPGESHPTNIKIHVSPVRSAELKAERACYDLELALGNEVIRLLEGTVQISANVTR